MSPFKLPFKKVHAPCCGPRSKTNGLAEQGGAHGFPASEKKPVKVGLSSNFAFRRSHRAGKAKMDSTPYRATTCDSGASTCDSIASTDSVCSTASFTLRQYCDSNGSLHSDDFVQQDSWDHNLIDEVGLPLSPASPCVPTPAASTVNGVAPEEDSPASSLATIENSFMLRSALKGGEMTSSAWSIAEEYDQLDQTATELQDEVYKPKKLEDSVAELQRNILEKERHLEALEKQEKLELFRRTKQQALHGECFAIVYCAIFRACSIVSSRHEAQ